jgi:hydroxymethylpyrimidine pyrophosphatase-like HAD family hydrolase
MEYSCLQHKLVSSVAEIPVYPKCVYFIDLDGTILRQQSVFLKKPKISSTGKPIYIDSIDVLKDDKVLSWLNQLSENECTKVFVTARDERLSQETLKTLTRLGIRDYHYIYFTTEKGLIIRQWLDQHCFEKAIFVDDMEHFLLQVKSCAPEVDRYRIDSPLSFKLKLRIKKK